jgi:hypothetical protein
MLARITGGSATMHTSISCHDTEVSTTTDTNSNSALDTNMASPSWMSSDRESTSEVMRDTSTPALERS